ncbi:MAG TPA: acetylornithine transaminase [Jiangellales bacterium]|nr:acetylornithine transaminase [Jiangellales bacterium]
MTGWQSRHAAALMDTYGPPRRVLVRGEGCWVWDDEGRRYLDLLAGIAVNSLGHAHPALVQAVSHQLATLGHVSNFFATPPQVELAERLLALLGFGGDGRVFLCNSGTEALEAAFKLARRTGRPRVVAAAGGFHGRSMGALALTAKPAAREPFQPLPGGVEHVPYGDVAALDRAVDDTCAAVVLEPVQGEGGVRPAPEGYLEAARAITSRNGTLLVLDEVQTGVGRTGEWFAFQAPDRLPDVVTVAKGLGGGFPVGACVAAGAAAGLLGPGSHGSTFGGNPVAAAAALAVLDTIESEGLLARVGEVGARLRSGVDGLGHPLVAEVRGAGLLLGIVLRTPVADRVAAAALEAGFVVNDVAPDVVRLAPPLVLGADQADSFVAALPRVLDAAWAVHPAPTGPAGTGEVPR